MKQETQVPYKQPEIKLPTFRQSQHGLDYHNHSNSSVVVKPSYNSPNYVGYFDKKNNKIPMTSTRFKDSHSDYFSCSTPQYSHNQKFDNLQAYIARKFNNLNFTQVSFRDSERMMIEPSSLSIKGTNSNIKTDIPPNMH